MIENLTVIIPLHIFNEEVSELLQRAVNSVNDGVKIILSVKYGLQDIVQELFEKNSNVLVIEANEESFSDFCTLTNLAVENVTTDWFSILEYDDYYTSYWFEDSMKYLYSDKDAKIYLPLVDLYDYNRFKNHEGRSYLGYANEASWASSFSNDLGYIDNECLGTYFNFNLTGGIFHTETFKQVGCLKPNIQMSFWYEFMLRFTSLGHKIYVIPKVGYNHFMNREGSLSVNYANSLTNEEAEYWLDVAKKECHYTECRNVKPFENNQNNNTNKE